jgi:hypothetical protein
MRSANIWRANFEKAHLDKIFENDSHEVLHEDQMSKRDFSTLKDETTKGVPAGVPLETALMRIQTLDPGIPNPRGSMRNILENASADRGSYEIALAEQLKTLVCSGDEHALSILRGLIRRDILDYPPRIKATGAQAASLVKTILGPDCPVFCSSDRRRQSIAEKNRERGNLSGRHALTTRPARLPSAQIGLP